MSDHGWLVFGLLAFIALSGYWGTDDAFLWCDLRSHWWLAGSVPEGRSLTPLPDALAAAAAWLAAHAPTKGP